MAGDPNDAFWLAQTHFLTGHYLRAERLLTEPLPTPLRSPLPPRKDSVETELNGFGRLSKGKERMDEPASGHGLHVEGSARRARLIDESLACRYLAAQCLVRIGANRDPLDLTRRCNKRSIMKRWDCWESPIHSGSPVSICQTRRHVPLTAYRSIRASNGAG